MIHFCFSVTQDCLQLIADTDTPTIRKGNKHSQERLHLAFNSVQLPVHFKSKDCIQTPSQITYLPQNFLQSDLK